MLKWWTEKLTELASSRITSEASWFVSSGFPTVQLMTPSLGVQKYCNVNATAPIIYTLHKIQIQRPLSPNIYKKKYYLEADCSWGSDQEHSPRTCWSSLRRSTWPHPSSQMAQQWLVLRMVHSVNDSLSFQTAQFASWTLLIYPSKRKRMSLLIHRYPLSKVNLARQIFCDS